MKIKLALALLLSQSLSATTFFANYQPSLDTPVSFNDLWPGTYTPLDADALASLNGSGTFVGATLTGGPIVFTPVFPSVRTEFGPSSTFTASHLTVPIRSQGNGSTLIGATVAVLNEVTMAFESLGGSGGRIRPSGFASFNPNFVDVTVPFGNNNTGSAGGFVSIPILFEEGRTYRVSLGGVAGSVGGFVTSNSFNSSGDTNTTFVSGFPGNVSDFQPAFALNDGTNSSFIPEPSTGILAFLSLTVLAKRKRR
ncbi:MAG: hypothetical protein AAGC74_10960 [Verrucomicrobiota bacterium]